MKKLNLLKKLVPKLLLGALMVGLITPSINLLTVKAALPDFVEWGSGNFSDIGSLKGQINMNTNHFNGNKVGIVSFDTHMELKEQRFHETAYVFSEGTITSTLHFVNDTEHPSISQTHHDYVGMTTNFLSKTDYTHYYDIQAYADLGYDVSDCYIEIVGTSNVWNGYPYPTHMADISIIEDSLNYTEPRDFHTTPEDIDFVQGCNNYFSNTIDNTTPKNTRDYTYETSTNYFDATSIGAIKYNSYYLIKTNLTGTQGSKSTVNMTATIHFADGSDDSIVYTYSPTKAQTNASEGFSATPNFYFDIDKYRSEGKDLSNVYISEITDFNINLGSSKIKITYSVIDNDNVSHRLTIFPSNEELSIPSITSNLT